MRRALVACAIAVVAACGKSDQPPADTANTGVSVTRIEVGQPAPSYAATNMAGDSVSLASLRGKVVLLNVWATWCGPCRKEIPELRAIQDLYKAQGLELVGVSVDADGTDAEIRAFVDEFSMNYPVWRDPNERVSATFFMSGVPATFLIDRQGVLRWKATGAVEPGDASLKAAIEEAIRGG